MSKIALKELENKTKEQKSENFEIKKSKTISENSLDSNKILPTVETKNTMGLEKMLFLFENEDSNEETNSQDQNDLHDHEENKLNLNEEEEINENKLHDYLNCDLINALDTCTAIPNISENSNVGTTLCSDIHNCSINSSNSQKLNHGENNFNLFNKETKTNLEHNSIGFFRKKNIINSENTQVKEDIKKSETKKEEKTIRDYLGKINPLDIPAFIPKKFKNKKKEEENMLKKNKEINNILKNKYDDDVDSVVIISNVMNEEKTKLPLEIRDGDWVCLYCNNLNFSFRLKCNRCGLLRKSSSRMMDNIMEMNENMGYNNNYDQNNYGYEE